MENKPYVVMNQASVWTCLDCGAKNYTDLTPLDTPADKARAAQEGYPPDATITAMPPTVKCIQCSKEWATTDQDDEEPPGPLDFLDDLYDLIDVLGHGGRARRKKAADFIRVNHQVFMDSLKWLADHVPEADAGETAE